MPEPRGAALDAEAIGDLAAAMRDGEARFVVERSEWPAILMSLRNWPTLVIRTVQKLDAQVQGVGVTFSLDLLIFDPEGPVVPLCCYIHNSVTGQEDVATAWLNPTDAFDRRILSGLASVPVVAVYLFSFQNAPEGGEWRGGGGVGHLTRDVQAAIAEFLETTWEMTTQWPEAQQRAEAEWGGQGNGGAS